MTSNPGADAPAGLVASDGQRIALVDGLTIGRQAGSGLRLEDTTVSREHAVVTQRGSRWLIRDCGSRNGTRVNGARLPAFTDHTLHDGDRVTLGKVVVFQVAIGGPVDHDATTSLQLSDIVGSLSPYQLRVIGALAEPWLHGREPATNAEIAAALGTPLAGDAVKAALRRCYAKLGIADLPTHTKRRELCRRAVENGLL